MAEILKLADDIIVFDRKYEKSFTSVGFELKIVDWQEVDSMVRHGVLLANDGEARLALAESDYVSKETVLAVRAKKEPETEQIFAKRQWQYRKYLAQKVGENDPSDYSHLQWMSTGLQNTEVRHIFENGLRLEIPEIDFISRAVLQVPQIGGDNHYYKFPNTISKDDIRLMTRVPKKVIESGKFKIMTPEDIRTAYDLYGKVDEKTYFWVLADDISKVQ